MKALRAAEHLAARTQPSWPALSCSGSTIRHPHPSDTERGHGGVEAGSVLVEILEVVVSDGHRADVLLPGTTEIALPLVRQLVFSTALRRGTRRGRSR
jgi:hypothetical protein